MTNASIERAAQFLKSCKNTYILIHQNPDGDCIACGFALKYYLINTGRKAKVICEDDIPKKYLFMTDENNEDFEPENIISVDVADADIFGKNVLEKYGKNVEFSIDHHEVSKPFANETYCVPGMAAAAEVLWKLFKFMKVGVDERIAECLYTGMATDTGCFKFSNAAWDTFEAVAEVKKQFPNINYADINRRVFTIKSAAQMRLRIEALNSIKLFMDEKVAVMTITLDMMEKTGACHNEIDTVVNIPLEIETVKVGIVLKEREPGVFKISMRGTDDCNVDVSQVCGLLDGGGHKKAAGCKAEGSPEEVLQKVLDAVKRGGDLSPAE